MLYLSEMVIDREDEIRERKAAPRCPHILLSAGSYGIRAPFSDIITSYLLQAYASWLALIRASWPVTAPPSTTPSSPIYYHVSVSRKLSILDIPALLQSFADYSLEMKCMQQHTMAQKNLHWKDL